MSSWKNLIGQGVVVFSASYCPHCTKAKNTLKSLGVAAKVIECDLEWSPAQISELKSESGHTTFPNIFVGDKHVKGNSDLQNAISDKSIFPLFDKYGVAYSQ